MLFLVFLATGGAIAAAIYTKLEVDIARKTLEVTKESSISQIRAYVFVKSYPWVNNVVENSIFNSTVGIRNGGQTPASELSLNLNVEARDTPPENTRRAFAATTRRSIETVLDPSTDLSGIGTIGSEKPLNSREFSEIIHDQKTRLYVWGVANYRDVFGETHHSYFCFFYFGRQANHRDGGFGARLQGSCTHPNPD